MDKLFDQCLKTCFGLILVQNPRIIFFYGLWMIALTLHCIMTFMFIDTALLFFSGLLWSYVTIPFYYLLKAPSNDTPIQASLNQVSHRVLYLLGCYLIFPALILLLAPMNDVGFVIARVLIGIISIIYMFVSISLIEASILSELIKRIPNIQSISPNDIYAEIRTLLMKKIIAH